MSERRGYVDRFLVAWRRRVAELMPLPHDELAGRLAVGLAIEDLRREDAIAAEPVGLPPPEA